MTAMRTTNRDLITLAAKARGIEIRWERSRGKLVARQQSGGYCGIFNPLDDWYAAMDVAVHLPGLNLQWIIAEAWQAYDTHDERCAHVRRAIVKAAAEAGKAMQ